METATGPMHAVSASFSGTALIGNKWSGTYALADFAQGLSSDGLGLGLVQHGPTGELFASRTAPSHAVVRDEDVENLLHDARAQLQLQHPCILRLLFFADTTSVHMLLEHACGGSLFALLQRRGQLPDAEAGPVFGGVISALGFIHRRGYAHRDVRPENVLLCEGGAAKLSDFGWCARLSKDAPQQADSGDVAAYLAPEAASNRPQGRAVDVWAAGILLFELLLGCTPQALPAATPGFEQRLRSELRTSSTAGGGVVAPEVRDLIGSLLAIVPEQRMSLVEVLQHFWIRQHAPAYFTGPGSCRRPSSPSSTVDNGMDVLQRLATVESIHDLEDDGSTIHSVHAGGRQELPVPDAYASSTAYHPFDGYEESPNVGANDWRIRFRAVRSLAEAVLFAPTNFDGAANSSSGAASSGACGSAGRGAISEGRATCSTNSCGSRSSLDRSSRASTEIEGITRYTYPWGHALGSACAPAAGGLTANTALRD
mmetsp:Transcript_17509/g.33733  ORF Transcript_17509/g.33733 Transcript_17509/m.33733 type:complete len:484 (+) Transcript_17509:17-1468(+)